MMKKFISVLLALILALSLAACNSESSETTLEIEPAPETTAALTTAAPKETTTKSSKTTREKKETTARTKRETTVKETDEDDGDTDSNGIVGKWKIGLIVEEGKEYTVKKYADLFRTDSDYEDLIADIISESYGSCVFHFKSNGKGVVTLKSGGAESETPFVYTLEGNSLKMTHPDGSDISALLCYKMEFEYDESNKQLKNYNFLSGAENSYMVLVKK